jgi:hypothetical protein
LCDNNQNYSHFQKNDEYANLIPENSFLKVDENIFKDINLYKILLNKERKPYNTKIKLTPFQKKVEVKKSDKLKIYEKSKENNFFNKSIREMKILKIDHKDFYFNLNHLNSKGSNNKDRISIIRKLQRIQIKENSERFFHRSLIEDQLSPLITEGIFTSEKKENNFNETNLSAKENLNNKVQPENINNKKDYTDYYKCLRGSVFFRNFESEYDSLKPQEISMNNQECQTKLNLVNNKTTIVLNNSFPSITEKLDNESYLATKESNVNIKENQEFHQKILPFKKILDKNTTCSYNYIGDQNKKSSGLFDYNLNKNNKIKKNDLENSKSSLTHRYIVEDRDPIINSNGKIKKKPSNFNNYYSANDN